MFRSLTTLCFALSLPATSTALPDAVPRSDLDAIQLTAFEEGAVQFNREFQPEDGIGPQLNFNVCVACHHTPVPGGDGPIYRGNLHSGMDLRAALQSKGPWVGPLQQLGVEFIGTSPDGTSLVHKELLQIGVGEQDEISTFANAMSVRKSSDIRGTGLIARIPNGQIRMNEARQLAEHPSIAGRRVEDENGRVARFGSQLQMPTTLRKLVEQTFERELGVDRAELLLLRTPSGELVRDSVEDFLAFAEPPPGRPTDWKDDGSAAPDDPLVVRGEAVFDEANCAVCHRPSYLLDDGTVIWPYSDFLLHDMGPALDDGVALGQAKSAEYRTTPLWGFGDRGIRLLHDHRGGSLEQTVRWHGGQATQARIAWESLSLDDRQALERFLESLGTPNIP